jgi:hypothetical protein
MPIQLNASDIHLRSSQAMGLRTSDALSISVWINATWTGGARISLIGIYGPATDVPLGAPITAVQIGSTAGGGELSCWTWGGGTLTTTVAGSMTAFNGQWVHLVYTHNGGTHTLYRNGVQVSTSTTAQITGFLNQVYVNGFPGGGTSEVASFQADAYTLYRRALTADEVLTIYNAQGDRHGIVTSLICHYDFDELGQGATCTSVNDTSGTGLNLTVTGVGTAITHTYTAALANSNLRPVQ